MEAAGIEPASRRDPEGPGGLTCRPQYINARKGAIFHLLNYGQGANLRNPFAPGFQRITPPFDSFGSPVA